MTRRVGALAAILLLPVALGAARPDATRTGQACAPVPAYPAPDPTRPRYALRLRVDVKRGFVVGSQTVRFTPNRPAGRLVFRLWPNSPWTARRGSRLTVGPVTSAARRLRSWRPDPTTLTVLLRKRLRAGAHVTVSLSWRLTVRGKGLTRLGRAGGALRLASFFPLLAWDPRSGWVVDPPTSGPVETSTSPVADFDVRVRIPQGLTVVASGVESAPGRWHARAVRDFALAVGRFAVVTGTAHAPRAVRVTAAVQAGSDAKPSPFLAQAVRALDALSKRYGRYPWPTYSVAVMPDIVRSGIEYPTIVFEGPVGLLRVTTHEAGHQWFYSLVGNDQARDPWLDEGLASWTQSQIDGILPYFKSVPIPDAARGHMGAPMTYWDQHFDAYFAGVYAQAVQAFDSLGDNDRVDCALRAYAARNAYRIARPSDLLDALEREFPDARAKLRGYGVTG